MPDPSTGAKETVDLPTLIMSASSPVWERISAALKVVTREDAIALCEQDAGAAATVAKILSGTGKSALAQTQASARKATALNSAPETPSAADVLYGGAAAKLQV